MARRRADACYRELGAELRKRRIAANLTMRELAYHLDWSPSTVSRVESGYIGLPTTEVLPPPRSSRAIRFSGSAANIGCHPRFVVTGFERSWRSLGRDPMASYTSVTHHLKPRCHPS
ncbi:MAG: helix-turn-helix domain-containing protein, partial [Nocardioidaceae bacterium]